MISITRLLQSSPAGTLDLQCLRVDLQLVGAQASVWIVLLCEIVGKGTRGQFGGRSERARSIALLAREARGRDAVGALAAVDYLGHVAAGVSLSSVGLPNGRLTGAQRAGSVAVSRLGHIPAHGWLQSRQLHGPETRLYVLVDAAYYRPRLSSSWRCCGRPLRGN